jgi:paraquat-inducible protein B
MANKQIYEYMVVTDYLGNLERGTRLYYDYDQQGYVYHYETDRSKKGITHTVKSFISKDYFISVDVAYINMEKGLLTAGPELGILEISN